MLLAVAHARTRFVTTGHHLLNDCSLPGGRVPNRLGVRRKILFVDRPLGPLDQRFDVLLVSESVSLSCFGSPLARYFGSDAGGTGDSFSAMIALCTIEGP